MIEDPRPTRPDRLGLGEGIRWTGDALVLVDILEGRLLTAPQDPTAPLRTLAELPVPLGAVAPVAGRPGTWIAAAGTGICLLDPDSTTTWLARPEAAARPARRMNDGAADPSGRFWAGSMAYDADEGAGSLYRVDHDGAVTRVLDGISVPNGPAFTADGRTMYLADSARGVVRRHPVDPATGGLGAPTTFVTVDDGSPDGMVVDDEGAVWIAVWGTGTVRRYRPDGELDRTLRLPASRPAGVCLQGDVLHITTATVGLTAPGPYDGAVFSVRVGVPGPPAAEYRPAAGPAGGSV
ncbi:SMP-30/gluconolactonase/LRE family protein [Streptomyces malaysiensis subsp. malaysiensis]|uniref:SMP-30/gluconolactonase/LRE family protein n=1 Tax=Streptomyces malaysiensis TaxID=92644 RepID=A0ABX6WCC1_STRMQ|nr:MULTISPECIES: SMP-30/gluconolactonase/LRE family protein [Streptomyces]QPI59083.1 SMP-30/gluconolactonase/LRE family protein [Streptomyces solisilvae]UHH20725.1 SMP-30/gluconolactonase/LRE family protein [Streptomyces sp. HNM0561]